MNLEEIMTLINNWILASESRPLDSREEAIIKGTLQGLSYEEMKSHDPALRGLNVSYIARYVAHNLWSKLTRIFQEQGLIDTDERVRKSNLWEYLTKASEKGLTSKQSLSPSSLSNQLLDQILLRRYRIIEDLVSNEFSTTYLAEDIGFSQAVPCIVKQWKTQSQGMTQRFQREAWALKELGQHDQIPQLLADFEEDGYYYIVHQFIEGQYISQKFLLNPLPWPELKVIDLLKKILFILNFVHDKKVIHREINPDNLIERNSDGKIVLLGFGSIKQVATGQTITIQNSNRGYIAPEQAVGCPQPRSDVYAVGKLGIQTLTGIEPTKFKVDPDTLNPVWREQAQINPQLADILDKMVCYDFRQRYASALEALQALDSIKLSDGT